MAAVCTCCCLTKFPSLPVFRIFSPKLLFFCLLFKSSLRDDGSLEAALAKKGLAKREGLDILNSRKKKKKVKSTHTTTKRTNPRMLPAGAAASKKSFELHFSAATVNSIKCCWMGSMGLPLGFLLNKRHHAVAKAIWLTCGMYMCVPKTAGDSFAMVKASARSERQMLEKGIDTHTHTHPPHSTS